MAKQFFYVGAGILCLVAGYQLGASGAVAGFVQATPPGITAVSGLTDAQDGIVLLDSGALVAIHEGSFEVLASTLPVPVSDVLALEGRAATTPSDPFRGFLITTTGRVWTHGNVPGWQDIGTIPGVGPVPVEAQSFGKVKARFR